MNDDDLEECWSDLEPLPEYVYRICDYSSSLLKACVVQYRVLRSEGDSWVVCEPQCLWSGKDFKEGVPDPQFEYVFEKTKVFTSPSSVNDEFRDLRATEIAKIVANKLQVNTLIQQKQAEAAALTSLERDLQSMNRPDIHVPMTQFADIEKLT